MSTHIYTPPDVLEAQALSLEELARACRMDSHWVIERVSTGILQCDAGCDAQNLSAHTSWRFSTHTVIRARRIADLERIFDADPQLAALTADLMEEVRQLRKQIKA